MANSNTETTQSQNSHPEDIRFGLSIMALRQALRDNLYCMQVRDRSTATLNDLYMATAYTVRDRLLKRWMKTGMCVKTSKVFV